MNKILLPSRKIMTALVVFFGLINVGYGATLYCKYVCGHGRLGGLIDLFNLNSENSIPTWFETIEFFVSGVLLYLISRIKQNRGNPWTRHWTLLSLIFLYLSLDESAGIHELSIGPLRKLLGISGGLLYYAWVIPAALLLMALIAYYWKFLWTLPPILKKRFFISGILFVSGAIIAELFGGAVASHLGENNLRYIALVWIEEFCEMAALLLFISTLLDWLDKDAGEFLMEIG